MSTILIKNLPEDLLKELKKLKVELGCKTWADLLSELVTANETILLTEEKTRRMKKGVKKFLDLRANVSSKWTDQPTVLEENRRSRHHAK